MFSYWFPHVIQPLREARNISQWQERMATQHVRHIMNMSRGLEELMIAPQTADSHESPQIATDLKKKKKKQFSEMTS